CTIALFNFPIPRNRPSLRVGTIENQARDIVGVRDGIPNGGSTALGNAKQDEWLARLGSLDDLLEVFDRTIQRELVDVPIAHAAAAVVIADEARMTGEELDPVSPDGAVQLVFQMREPVRHLHDRRPVAG